MPWRFLQDVADGAPDYKFLPAAMAKRAGPAAQRGIDCLLKLQIVDNGVKTAWAQQYDALTLEPTSARNYEMAALTSDESFPIVEFFMSLPDPTPAEVAAVHAACAWFTKVEIFGYRLWQRKLHGRPLQPRRTQAGGGCGSWADLGAVLSDRD